MTTTPIPISEFLKDRTQAEAAALLGCTQSAVSQMVRSGRDIRIETSQDGSYSYFEIKRPRNSA